MQAAVYMDATLWAFNKARHGARHAAMSLMVARAKELRRRHSTVRAAVAGPAWLRTPLDGACRGPHVRTGDGLSPHTFLLPGSAS